MEDKVLDIFEDVTGTDEIREDLDLDLFEAGLLDSLGIIEVLLKIEDVFGIKLQPTDLERRDMATVNNLVNFLESLKVNN
ncbi:MULTISPECIES: D-alanine--poly(phosphoribitol) ligase subunit DltC [Clostridium]|jgi:D-alanine--poly(phosphoribitol) ligase subunit 2|uniref:D-alanine--poly(phosphoribitol) ligase subunit DltC n=1 Tax=Clostridium TaxID=1485 RepID=UPI000BE2E997|nr:MULTISPECIES: D-alanine--poly(phosphoribitol) ligase subunit DltC [Clostridium]MBS6501544.1 D-alanine--poly(phosphoribitol) ligase subunit DltC [Clostridium sp.]MBU6134262.1 D-alanine--poly(phosphoribitol) ligase subunit DltC [Clostridium tertium]MDB1934449.1 D-alanine--poly(phosphoribitol) ligase subunit DltC [Clostridium tertium]MDB1937687.1 D-alanine--poly(phosphoribitol) ligase subunit DltC [Clostridium tertium]MDB1953776.1 D-alanine--poly(phosphoribitol) ligase subunit DltC [Clostridiu